MIDIICILFFVLITICISIGCYKSKHNYNTNPIEDTIIYTDETDNDAHNIKLSQEEKINEADINTGDSLMFKM